MKNLKSVGIVYGFSETNHAVFQNAGIWSLQKEKGIETVVYAPKEYIGLYWSAKKSFLISPSPYESVSEIHQYEKNAISRRKIRTWFTAGALNFIINQILSVMPANLYHALPKYLSADYKSRKFLFRSGIYRMCKRHFVRVSKRGEARFLGTTSYTNPANMEKIAWDLKKQFQVSFQNLYNQISSGALAVFSPYDEIPSKDDVIMKEFFSFIKKQEITIFLRTRNLRNSIAIHNASKEKLKPVINYLLENGISVVNSGTPPVSLGIDNLKYFELDHSYPVDLELSLALKCDYVMNSAWAGLFVAVATLNTSLITFDKEWSVLNLTTPISILDARARIGLRDLNLMDQIDNLPADEVGRRIVEYCTFNG